MQNTLVLERIDQALNRAVEFRTIHSLKTKALAERRAEMLELKAKEALYEKALWFLQEISKYQEDFLKDKFVKTVRYGLGMTFGDDLGFDILVETKANQRIMSPAIKGEDGEWITDFIEEDGGGLAECLSFLLNAMLIIWQKDARKILFLDESFSKVSVDYKAALLDMIKVLSTKFGIQFVIITHDPDVEGLADINYRFRKLNGRTQMEVVK